MFTTKLIQQVKKLKFGIQLGLKPNISIKTDFTTKLTTKLSKQSYFEQSSFKLTSAMHLDRQFCYF